MTDREMLEWAARAAGYVVESYISDTAAFVYEASAAPNEDGEFPIFRFAPRDDDGDALRLAVKLHLFVIVEGDQPDDPRRRTLVGHRSIGSKCVAHSGDPYAATRRAITRAAAEIGRGMG